MRPWELDLHRELRGGERDGDGLLGHALGEDRDEHMGGRLVPLVPHALGVRRGLHGRAQRCRRCGSRRQLFSRGRSRVGGCSYVRSVRRPLGRHDNYLAIGLHLALADPPLQLQRVRRAVEALFKGEERLLEFPVLEERLALAQVRLVARLDAEALARVRDRVNEGRLPEVQRRAVPVVHRVGGLLLDGLGEELHGLLVGPVDEGRVRPVEGLGASHDGQ
mmetsp:Transcript_16978/g.56972  ORF Transcript_16978/g.56972 Transcript_16978/m.56972 type:complete len:220 (-) Transcript_16978:3-662(-)